MRNDGRDRQKAYECGGSRSTGSATTQKPHTPYLDRVRVVKFPRRLIRHLETPDLPLQTLQAIRRLRRYLEELEAACIIKARELGASPSDIGEALGITRQAVYNRLHNLEQRAEHDPEFVIPDLSGEDVEETTKEIVDLEHTTDQR
jgi:DNA-directed RNA polymerase specialized sigma24 family protein